MRGWWTERQVARAKMSDAAFKRGLPKESRALCDSDYSSTLSEEDRVYLRTFEQEYYGGRFERGGKQLNLKGDKRECTTRLSRLRRNAERPIFEPEEAVASPEDQWIEGLDNEEFEAWKVKNSNSLQKAKALFIALEKTRRRLRLVKLLRALMARKKIMNRYANRASQQGDSDNPDEADLANSYSRLHKEIFESGDSWGVVAGLGDGDGDLG